MKISTVVWIDGIMSFTYWALFAWSQWAAHTEAEDAIKRYGSNVDSGNIEFAVGIIYFMPVAFLFGLAAFMLAISWRFKWYLHWFAVICAVMPLFLPGFAFIKA